MAGDLASRDDGAALVEAAFVLPILLILIMGLADVSLFYWNLNLAGKAVQLGLRRAVVSEPVAIGPGLEPAESASYWDGLEPGARCELGSDDPCPRFAVTCHLSTGCLCAGGPCRFAFAPSRLTPIIESMRAVLPNLRLENVQLRYATKGRGYVGRPMPVPVDVEVTLVGLSYAPAFLGAVFGSNLPLRASAILPSESLSSR